VAPVEGRCGVDLFAERGEALGAGRTDERGHAWDRTPAHIHAACDFRNIERRRLCHHAEITGDSEGRSAADAPAFDRHDRHGVDLFPCFAHLGPGAQGETSRREALAALFGAGRVLEVSAEREVGSLPGEDHCRDFRPRVKAARCFGELAQGFG
jgi:hypothetical protein